MPPAASMTAQQRHFDTFRDAFNQIRPHEGIDMARPADLYRQSPRSMPHRLTPYDDPAHYLVRRVSRAGTIRVLNRQFFLSSTLKEHYVGLEEVDTGLFDSCFYQIGRYDVERNVVEDIISRVPDGYAHPLERPKVLPMSRNERIAECEKNAEKACEWKNRKTAGTVNQYKSSRTYPRQISYDAMI